MKFASQAQVALLNRFMKGAMTDFFLRAQFP